MARCSDSAWASADPQRGQRQQTRREGEGPGRLGRVGDAQGVERLRGLAVAIVGDEQQALIARIEWRSQREPLEVVGEAARQLEEERLADRDVGVGLEARQGRGVGGSREIDLVEAVAEAQVAEAALQHQQLARRQGQQVGHAAALGAQEGIARIGVGLVGPLPVGREGGVEALQAHHAAGAVGGEGAIADEGLFVGRPQRVVRGQRREPQRQRLQAEVGARLGEDGRHGHAPELAPVGGVVLADRGAALVGHQHRAVRQQHEPLEVAPRRERLAGAHRGRADLAAGRVDRHRQLEEPRARVAHREPARARLVGETGELVGVRSPRRQGHRPLARIRDRHGPGDGSEEEQQQSQSQAAHQGASMGRTEPSPPRRVLGTSASFVACPHTTSVQAGTDRGIEVAFAG